MLVSSFFVSAFFFLMLFEHREMLFLLVKRIIDPKIEKDVKRRFDVVDNH
jgi:hypothetical protein